MLNIFSTKKPASFHKDNGQYIKNGVAKIDDEGFYSIDRLALQENYFSLILEYCKNNKIEVFLCMLPTRKNIYKNFKQEDIDEFHSYINSYTNEFVHYLNYSKQEGWSLADYTDIAHFNEESANTFSKILNEDILRLINSKK